MKYLPLVWAGLWRTPLRTALTFLSIATTFLLFGTLYGVNAGLNQAIERISPNRLHVTPINLDRGLPVSYGQEIDQIPGVASTMVSTLMSASYRDPRNYLYIAAVSGRVHLDVFGDIPDGDRLVAKLQATRTGAIVGRATAEKNGFKVGDRVSLYTGPGLNLDGTDFMVFDIVGIYDVPTAPELARWFLLNFDYLTELRDLRSTTNLYVETADPSRNAEVALAIDRHFDSGEAATYTAPEREYQGRSFSRAVDMKLVVTVIISASMFALLMLSTSTLMHSVRQRVPELAVMKSLGFTRRQSHPLRHGRGHPAIRLGCNIGNHRRHAAVSVAGQSDRCPSNVDASAGAVRCGADRGAGSHCELSVSGTANPASRGGHCVGQGLLEQPSVRSRT